MINPTAIMVARSYIKSCDINPARHMDCLNAMFGDPPERGFPAESLLFLAKELALLAYQSGDKPEISAPHAAVQQVIESAVESLGIAFKRATYPDAFYE